ncbi:hypothetical protein [Bradyrhizobium sp. Tv2a-2]|uniref:SctD/MshK family protein n=1 Tax=Bradyrhizobium sp. Tv2a-2 TaxID=113395 RepID=UPI0012EBB3BB|nr:hypothetical protein [Bradyrhizobium sp. Tv2a-2]
MIGVLALYNGAEERSFAATLSSHQTLSDAPPADLAAAFLRQQAGEAGLTELVVTPRTDGAVMIGGVLGQAQQRDWSAVRQKFDQRFGTERVLVEQFDAAAFIPSVHVAAVWSGANPYMVDDHGNRLRPGASLGDGWSIQSIDSQNVTVRQGPRTVALRY